MGSGCWDAGGASAVVRSHQGAPGLDTGSGAELDVFLQKLMLHLQGLSRPFGWLSRDHVGVQNNHISVG